MPTYWARESFDFSLFLETEPCLYMRVNLKDDALKNHEEKPGIYHISETTVNGMPSWISSSKKQAIWYVSQFEKWAIGPLDSI